MHGTNRSSIRQSSLFPETISSSEIHEMLLERGRNAALAFALELLDDEVEELCGKRFSRKREERFHRGGSESTTVIVGGAKQRMRRPRVRNEDGEVALETLSKLRDQDLLDDKIRARMMLGITTRNYAPAIESYAEKLSVSKSSASRAFGRASAKALDELNHGDLSKHRFVGIIVDGIEFQGRSLVAALGITADLSKIPLGIREGDTENAEVVKDLLASILERSFTLHCTKLFAVIDGAKALKKALLQVFGDRVLIQRCYLHKLRNLQKYAPEQYHRQIHWRMKKLMNLTDHSEALKELASFTEWLSGISHECASSMEEVGYELLTVHRLRLPQKLRQGLSTTNALESLLSVVRDKTNRVKNWKRSKDKVQRLRWMAAAIQHHRTKMRRLRGHQQAAALVAALNETLETQIANAL